MDQDEAIKSRANAPYERVASAESTCPACQIIIIPGDKIASPANRGTSWRHLGCAICRHCGAWLTPEGACATDCTAGQAESENGSWHDLAITFTAPARAFALLYSEASSPSGKRKLPWCRIIGVKELAKPSRATTLSLIQAHLQFHVDGASSPSRDMLMQEAAKNIGLILGNEYRYFDVTKIAYDIGDVGISSEQVLSRPPAWASVSA